MEEAREYPVVEVTWQDAWKSTTDGWTRSAIVDDLGNKQLSVNKGNLVFESKDFVIVASQKIGENYHLVWWIPRSLLRPPGIVYFEPARKAAHEGQTSTSVDSDIPVVRWPCAICESPTSHICAKCKKAYCAIHRLTHHPCMNLP